MEMIRQTQSISIFDAIFNSSYQSEFKKDILSFLISNFNNKENSHQLYFNLQKENKNIILIRYQIKCSDKINLLIYLTETFPLTPPEIYIEKSKKTLMVDFRILKCSVSSETLQILYTESAFGKWIPKVNSTIKLLSTLSDIFQGSLPVCACGIVNNYLGKCILYKQEIIPIIFDTQEDKKTNANVFSQQLSKGLDSPYETKTIKFNDKKFLLREILPILEKKIDEEDKEINKQSKELKSLINELNEKIKLLDNIIYEMKIQLEEKDNKYQGNDIPAPPVAGIVDNVYEKVRSFINIKNNDDIQKYAKIKAHKEMLTIIKDAIQKNVISNDDAVKEIRKCEDIIQNSFINMKE